MFLFGRHACLNETIIWLINDGLIREDTKQSSKYLIRAASSIEDKNKNHKDY